MKKCIFSNELKAVYVGGNVAEKIFAPSYKKSDVLYEALNTARVEEAGVDIPKLISVSVENDQWVITSEYVEGVTLTKLMKDHPEKAEQYIDKMLEYQLSFQDKSNPLLLKLKDKLDRQLNELSEISSSTKFELQTRLASMPKHTKICHGDYCPDNIIAITDENNDIVKVTAVDWVHATQGNASADAANTYLLMKLLNPDLAETYITKFCDMTHTSKKYVSNWLPIVAAARLTKNKPEEKALLEQWIDIVDFQ